MSTTTEHCVMANEKVVVLPLLLLFLFAIYTEALNSHVNLVPNSTNTVQSLNVLFVSVPLPGHINPLLSLGEELVRRGHNVTFCSTDSWENVKDQAMERRIKYLSAGKVIDYELIRANIHKVTQWLFSRNPWRTYKVLKTIIEWQKASVSPIIEHLINNDVTQWDVVIFDYMLAISAPCIARYHNISAVGVFNRPVRNQPPWPYPVTTLGVLGQTDNLTFIERLTNIPSLYIAKLIINVVFSKLLITDQICNKVFHWGPLEEWEYPLIVRTVIGLEFPRTISPLTEYVGLILSKLNKPLPTNLSKWLQNEVDKSVIYISMGSIATTSHDLAISRY